MAHGPAAMPDPDEGLSRIRRQGERQRWPRAPHEQCWPVGRVDLVCDLEAGSQVAPDGTQVRGVWVGLDDGDGRVIKEMADEGTDHAAAKALAELVRCSVTVCRQALKRPG